ncbi:MAG: hypothetical protein ISN28_11235 [Ectothiorhodospiraceae bacterium AqS1]|nr:hypothetical protein [Ectothiorhodospiraceae bacterium AqS1]
MSLVNLLKTNEQNILGKTIQQLVMMAGNGKLGDGTPCSKELREFLKEIDREYLRIYANQCLENTFADSGFVLQDIVNEIGRRMGFDVEYGNYRGKRNQDNHDGTWNDNDSGWTFVIEVKTTDAYSIKLKKISSWLKTCSSSALIVVGRQDTETLEDQLRGSRYNWNMRIIGFESLYKALVLMEKSEDGNLRYNLVDILKPREFVRVDEILSIALDFSEDREDLFKEERDAPDISEKNNKKHRTIESDRDGIEKLKTDIARRIEKENDIDLVRRRSLFGSRKKDHRYVIAVSKPYEDNENRYWYSIHTRQINYLSEVDNAFFVMGCLDTKKAFAIPYKEMSDLIKNMNYTLPGGNEEKKFFHIFLRQENDEKYFIYIPNTKQKIHVENFEID